MWKSLFKRATILPFFKKWPKYVYGSSLEAMTARILSSTPISTLHTTLVPDSEHRSLLRYVRDLGTTNKELGSPISISADSDTTLGIKDWFAIEKLLYVTWLKQRITQTKLNPEQVAECLKSVSPNFGKGWHVGDEPKVQVSAIESFITKIIAPTFMSSGMVAAWTALLSVSAWIVHTVLSQETGLLSFLFWWVLFGSAAGWLRSNGGYFDARIFASGASSTWDAVFETKSETDAWLLARMMHIVADGYGYEKQVLSAFGSMTPKEAVMALMDQRNTPGYSRRNVSMSKLYDAVQLSLAQANPTAVKISEFQSTGPEEYFEDSQPDVAESDTAQASSATTGEAGSYKITVEPSEILNHKNLYSL